MGAVTVAVSKKSVGAYVPAGKCVLADITFSASYATGGDTYTAAQFGMSKVDLVVPVGPAVASATSGFDVMPDTANLKLRLLGMNAAAGVGNALTEVANASNQSAVVARCLVYGDNPHV